MPRVLPSMVVRYIKTTFPDYVNAKAQEAIQVHQHNLATISGLVSLVNKIPQELLVVDDNKYSGITAGLAALDAAVS